MTLGKILRIQAMIIGSAIALILIFDLSKQNKEIRKDFQQEKINYEAQHLAEKKVADMKIAALEESCQMLLKQNDSLKMSSIVKEERRKKVVQPAWDKKIAETKQDPDTSKINQLDSIFKLANAICDSALEDKNQVIENLEEVHKIDTEKLAIKDELQEKSEEKIKAQAEELKAERKEAKKQHRKIVVLKIVNGTLIAIGLTIAVVSLI